MNFFVEDELYKKSERLGGGGFGSVYLYKGPAKKKLAVKIQPNDIGAENEYPIQEELSQLPGAHMIVNVIAQYVGPTENFIFMEYEPKGSLHSHCIENRVPPPEMFKKFFQMMINGVKFIHGHGIVHRDIKPANLLLGSNGTLKIADFGIACRFFDDEGRPRNVNNTTGTVRYAAPELFTHENVSAPPLDIYSCGVTLLHIATGSQNSWIDVNDESFRRWERNETALTDTWHEDDPDEGYLETIHFLHRIVCTHGRLTIEEIEMDEWYSEGFHKLRMNPRKKSIFEN